MRISREDVLHVADLAHLELTDAEIEKFREQLDAILGYIEKLRDVDVSHVEPIAQIIGTHTAPEENLRRDVVLRSDVFTAILEQAPEAKAPYFRVPKVIER